MIIEILLGLVVVLVTIGAFMFHRLRYGVRRYETEKPELPAGLKDPAIIVFSKTNGYRHSDAIVGANAAVRSIAEENGWSVVFTESGAAFNAGDLGRFRATIWNNTTGDVLNTEQKEAFRKYVEDGGGFLGLHGAGGDFHYEWRWYVETLIGAQFIGHTLFPQMPTATIRIENHDDAATRNLPKTWIRADEWYAFDKSPRAEGVTVLATVDESGYKTRMAWKNIKMGADHPIVWKRRVGKGRAFYSAIGHAGSAYAEPNYLAMLEGAIKWAAGLEGRDRSASDED